MYLGDLGIDLDAPGLTIFVPADLAQRLEDVLLDPSFLVLAIPELPKEVENGLRDAADSRAPRAIADPLRTGADGVGVLRQGAEALANCSRICSRSSPIRSNLNDISTTIQAVPDGLPAGCG